MKKSLKAIIKALTDVQMLLAAVLFWYVVEAYPLVFVKANELPIHRAVLAVGLVITSISIVVTVLLRFLEVVLKDIEEVDRSG